MRPHLRSKNTKILKSVAHHEAGHAIAAWDIGMKPKGISIVPDERSLGRYQHHSYFGKFDATYDNSPEAQRRIEDYVVVCLAGGEAQRRFNRYYFRRGGCQSDYNNAAQALAKLTGDLDEEFHAYWKLLLLRSAKLVQFHWNLIRAVARLLVKHGELKADELSDLIEREFSARE